MHGLMESVQNGPLFFVFGPFVCLFFCFFGRVWSKWSVCGLCQGICWKTLPGCHFSKILATRASPVPDGLRGFFFFLMGQGFWQECIFCVGNGSRVVVVQVAFVFKICATRVPDGTRGRLAGRPQTVWKSRTGQNCTGKFRG